ncbi:MAG: sulfite exporter TauE/SafE family protein [Planctomycetota bacterium]
MLQHSLAILIIAVTHYVGGIATFGSSFLAVPLLLLVYGPEQLDRVVLVMIAVGALQAYLICWRTRRDVVRPVLLAMLLGAGAGIPIGVYGLNYLPAAMAMPLIGALILVAGALNLREAVASSHRHRPALTVLASMGAGIVHGAFASGGTVLVAYCQRVLSDKTAFRATLAMFWSCTNTAFLAGLFAMGSIGETELALSALAGAIALPVTWLADMTARRLNRRQFRVGVCVLLMFSGAALLLREGFQ